MSVAIAVDPQRTYSYASDPSNLPAWAPGFVKSIEKSGDHWVACLLRYKRCCHFAASLHMVGEQMELECSRPNKSLERMRENKVPSSNDGARAAQLKR
ncbi:MAG: SRPBCC family protein [Steroidobacteraceae bacterium]